jgi:adenylylsulfate kinase
VRCPIDVLEDRDTKGLYKKARAGLIKNFTGVNDPYEEPENPEVVVDTSAETIEQSAEKILKFLRQRGLVPEVAGART